MPCLALGLALAIFLPNLPGSRAAGVQTFELLLVFERIHTGPEAIVGIADQLFFRQQAMEGFDDQFLFVPHVLEYVFLEDKKAAVNPHAAVVNGVDSRNQAAIALFE